MRLSSACQTWISGLGAAMVCAAALPAFAGDLANGTHGGIKDYSAGGIPVPAPMPYEETYKWYLRGDIGTAFKHSGTIGVEGLPTTVLQPKDWHELSILSFGFGRYVTPSLRTEFTLDYRTPRNLTSGTKTLADTAKSGRLADGVTAGGASIINVQTNIYAGIQNENIDYQNTTFLMSAFYDFNREGRLKPYVGAGVGLARHELARHGTITYTCYDGFVTSTPGTVTNPGCAAIAGDSPLLLKYTTTTNKTATGWGVAGQVSAGLTYDLTPRTHWDTGYRMLWQSGRLGVTSSDGASTVRIADRFDHEVRTGIRWDIW